MQKFTSINQFDRVFFTSDPHYGHKNLCGGTTTWQRDPGAMLGCRDFETLEQYNERLVSVINATVDKDDLLIINGDIAFGGKQNLNIFRKALNVKVIWGCYGNHDHHLTSGNVKFFDNVDHTLYLTYKGQNMVLNHYPMYVWHQSHKNSWCLHGHTHGSINGQMQGKILDVGVDSYFKMYGEYGVFSFDQIKQYMQDRAVFMPSHHNAKTN